MPRLTTLEAISFPVVERPVFTTLDGPDGDEVLAVAHKKALVNGQTRRVLGVVSQSYRVVTNQEALGWAHECCAHLFPTTKPAEWYVDLTDAPASGGHCTIDLMHASAALSFTDVRPGKRPEVFGPFIRVTNSYNGLKALAFDIGFHRKVCRNGLIAPDTIIRFSFAHQRRDLGLGIRFEVAHDRLKKLQSRLGTYFSTVSQCLVPRMQFERLVRGVLLIRPHGSTQPGSKEAEDWSRVEGHLSGLCDQYAQELGENAYAVLNVMTDFASRPPESRHVQRDRHSLQRLAGRWLSDFNQMCCEPGFSLTEYLEKLDKGAERQHSEKRGAPPFWGRDAG